MNIEIHDNTKSQKFCSIFQHIKLFTDCINITFDKKQLYIQAMDSSHIVIFEIFLPSSWFCKYTFLDNQESVVLGLNAGILYKILNTRDKSQHTILAYSVSNSDKLNIHFSHEDPNIFDKHFELPLMDIESEMLGIPEFESNVTLIMPSSDFSSVVSSMQIFGDTIEFHCQEEKIQIVSSSSEIGKMEVDIENKILDNYELEGNDALKVSFALFKMHDICMYSKLANEIEIVLTYNYPIRITYDIGDDAKLVFYLAPKINDE